MALNRLILKNLREDINKALAPIGRQYGVKLTADSCRFSPNAGTFKLEVVSIDAVDAAVPVSKAAVEFKSKCWKYGLKPEHLGRKIRLSTGHFTIVGLNTRCSKYPILGISAADGKTYKLPSYRVMDAIRSDDLVAK